MSGPTNGKELLRETENEFEYYRLVRTTMVTFITREKASATTLRGCRTTPSAIDEKSNTSTTTSC